MAQSKSTYRNNCWHYACGSRRALGGEVRYVWSDHWFLHFHIVHISRQGIVTSFVPEDETYITIVRKALHFHAEWRFEGHIKLHKPDEDEPFSLRRLGLVWWAGLLTWWHLR